MASSTVFLLIVAFEAGGFGVEGGSIGFVVHHPAGGVRHFDSTVAGSASIFFAMADLAGGLVFHFAMHFQPIREIVEIGFGRLVIRLVWILYLLLRFRVRV
jgi:hypothetical protein